MNLNIFIVHCFPLNNQSGNVGINETSPQNKLDVSGAQVIGSSYAGVETAPSDGLLVEGNVGIGTTSPSEKLAVKGSGNTSATNSFIVTDSDDSTLFNIRDDGFFTLGESNLDVTSAGSLEFTQESNGNFQFGFKSGGFTSRLFLAVDDNNFANPQGFRLYSDDDDIPAFRNGANPYSLRVYNTSDGADDEYGVIGWNETIDVLSIGTEATGSGTVRDIALIGGDIGIGTSSPSELLSVEGDVSFSEGTGFKSFLYDAGQELLTLVNLIVTAVLEIPNGASPTVDADGEIAHDTTEDQLIYGADPHVLSATKAFSMNHASTTQGAATTTVRVAVAPYDLTVSQAQCDFSDFMGISLYDGTNRANYFEASSTIGTINIDTNNTFTSGEAIRVDVGTSTDIAADVRGSCSFTFTIDRK